MEKNKQCPIRQENKQCTIRQENKQCTIRQENKQCTIRQENKQCTIRQENKQCTIRQENKQCTIRQENSEKSNISDLKKIVKGLKSKQVGKQLSAVRSARALLREEAPATGLVEAGALEPLLHALDRKDWLRLWDASYKNVLLSSPSLQHEALDVLSGIAFSSPECTMAVVNSDVIPKLLVLLDDEGDLSQRAILCFGSLALHAEARRAARAHGAVAAILQRMHTGTPHKLLRTYVKAFTNLCSHDETILELVSPALPHLYELLNIEDEDCVDVNEHGLSIQPQLVVGPTDNATFLECERKQDEHKAHAASDVVEAACTALGNILHGGKECVEAVQCTPGLTQRLVALLSHDRDNVKGAALTAMENMLAGTDEQVQRCLDAGCVEPLVSLLQHTQASLVQEAARAAANILAGTHSHIHHALDKHILTPLRDILTHGDPECRQQAAYAVSCLCVRGSMEQLEQVASRGVLEPYVSWFAATSAALAGELVDGLHALIEAAERDGDLKLLCYKMDESDVLDQLLHLKESVADEEQLFKIFKLEATLRKHARMERFIVYDEEQFTAEKIVGELQSQQQTRCTRATRALYCLLSEQHPPIHALLEAGILAPLVTALHGDNCSNLENAAWSLSRITAGTYKHRMAVIESGAVPVLLSLLPRGDTVSELAACALGDMTPGHQEIRDALMNCMRSTTKLELMVFLRNYKIKCREYRKKSMEEMEPLLRALPLVSELLAIGDPFMQRGACHAIALIMWSTEHVEAAQAVPGLTERVVMLMHHQKTPVKEIAFIAVTNMLYGTSTQAERCLAAGCIEPIVSCLQSGELLNISARAANNLLQHPRAILPSIEKGLLDTLLMIMTSNTDTANKQHVAYAIIMLRETCFTMELSSALKSVQLRCLNAMEQYVGLLLPPDPTIEDGALYGSYTLLDLQDQYLATNVKDTCSTLDEIGVIEQLQEKDTEELDVRVKANQVDVRFRKVPRGEQVAIMDGIMYTVADIIRELKSEDLTRQTRAARAASTLFSPVKEDSPKTLDIIARLIPSLVAVLDRNDCPDLQEAVVITIARMAHDTYSHKLAVVNSGALPKLVSLLSHGNEIAVMAAATTLGDVSFHAPATRDLVLSLGVVPALTLHMRPDARTQVLRSCVKTYAILCDNHVSRSTMEPVLPALHAISELLGVQDIIVILYACTALKNITYEDAGESIEAVTALPGLIKRLVTLLRLGDTLVQRNALNVVTSLLGGTDTQADRCLEAGCLEPIVKLLWRPDPLVQEPAAQAICNLLHHENYARLLLDRDILTPLLSMLDYAEPKSHLHMTAAGTVAALIIYGTHEQRMAAIQQGGSIPKLVAVVTCEEVLARAAVVALIYMAENDQKTIEVMLRHNIVYAMTSHLTLKTPRDLLIACIHLYKFLCRYVTEFHKPIEMLDMLFMVLPHFSTILFTDDEEIIDRTILALFILMVTDAVMATSGLTARLVALVTHKATCIKKAAATTITLILGKIDTQMLCCLDAECVEQMLSHIQCRDPALMEEAAVLTRVKLGDSHPRLQRALHEDVLTPFMRLPALLSRYLSKAITNLYRLATPAQRARLVSSGVLEPYCALLMQDDPARAEDKLQSLHALLEREVLEPSILILKQAGPARVEDALHSLHALLQIAKEDGMLGSLCLKLEKIGVLEQLYLLRDHKDKEISKKARTLLQTYLPKKENNGECVFV